MAVSNNFPVTDVYRGELLDDYSNSLGTALLAMPFNDFDGNARIGRTERLGYPIQYLANDGLAYDPDTQINSTNVRYRTMSLDYIKNVPIAMDMLEMSFSSNAENLDEWGRLYISPMAIAAANALNAELLDTIEMACADWIGTPTSDLNGATTMLAVNAMLANMGLNSMRDKYFALSPLAAAGLQGPYATYFNPAVNAHMLTENTNDTHTYGGIKCYVDEQIIRHQNGVFDTGAAGAITVKTTPTAAGLNAGSQTVVLQGFAVSTANVLKRGDIIFFGSTTNPVMMLNPKSYNYWGQKKGFVVQQSYNSDSSGEVSIAVYPSMIATGPYQNISRAIVANDVVTIYGTRNTFWTKNFLWVKQAVRFANPFMASYPMQPGKGGSNRPQFAAYPFEENLKMKIQDTGLSCAFNLASQGDLATAANTIVARTIGGGVAFPGYLFGVGSLQ
jgi:hypothetical protein